MNSEDELKEALEMASVFKDIVDNQRRSIRILERTFLIVIISYTIILISVIGALFTSYKRNKPIEKFKMEVDFNENVEQDL